MAKIEPGVYEPRDDIRVFDGAEDDTDDEGSRLPLLIVIALMVLAAFGGVVYLAYTEGVQKGRADAPRVITAQIGPAKVAPTDAGGTVTPYKGLKIYQQPAPTDDEVADEDTAPAPPTEINPTKSSSATPITTSLPAPAKPKAPPSGADKSPEARAKSSAMTANYPTISAAPTPPLATNTPVASIQADTSKAAPAETSSVPPAAKIPAAVKPSHAAYTLQIGSYKSAAEADAAFVSLKSKNGALMSGYAADVKQVDLGEKGTWYRLRVGSFTDKEGATKLCERLGGACFPAKP